MKTDPSKAEYNAARYKALRDLAREHPERYRELIELHLGRSLKERGRVLPYRVERGEKPWGER